MLGGGEEEKMMCWIGEGIKERGQLVGEREGGVRIGGQIEDDRRMNQK